MACGHYQIAPSEYGFMTIREMENIHEARRNKMIGNLHEDDYIRLEKKRDELEAQNFKVL